MSIFLKRLKQIFFISLASICALIAANLEGAIINVPLGNSIQTAIDNAADGDTIQLEAGTYTQQFSVVSKNLTIIGAGEDVTIIQAPDASTHLSQNFNFGSNYWCVIIVDNQATPATQTVDISDLTVDGNNQQDTIVSPIYGNSDRFFAIGYHNANGTVQNVHTTNTRQTANFNELAGGGIISAADTGIVSFNASNVLVDFYQRIGIDCRGSALTATITDTEVNRGYVLSAGTTTATPNGIQFSGSAKGSISNTTTSSNIATVANAGGTGILLFGAGADVTVSGSTASNNDYGIVAISCEDNLTLTGNTVNFTTTPSGVNSVEGIAVQDTNGVTNLHSNVMDNIPDVNMDLSSSTNQSFFLTNNQFYGSQTGLLITGNATAGPVITFDGDSFSGTIGYYIQEVAAPNDSWPSTASVSFDGLLSGHITMTQFDAILTKIYDQHNDPALGLVLDFIAPSEPSLTSIAPASGSEIGGESITITGSSFLSSNTTVQFGANAAASTLVSDTTIIATAPPGTGVVDVTVTTPFGTTPIVPEDQYTYLEEALLPPESFVGHIRNVYNHAFYTMRTTWTASPSPEAVLYRIYYGDELMYETFPDLPQNFSICINSKLDALNYKIVSVNLDNEESVPRSLTIPH